MDKVQLLFTLLTVAIVLIPLVSVVAIYRDNLVWLVLPPQLQNLASGNISQMFQPPTAQGQPQYDPATQTVTFSFNFTNPLPNAVTVQNITGTIECNEHSFPLGDVSLPAPLTVNPHDTVIITATGHWTQDATAHLQTAHSQEDAVAVRFMDLTVELAGAKIHVDNADAGSIPLPPR